MPSVSAAIVIPPGVYYINKSINWTDLVAWNIHIDMRGAKLVAGPGCAGLPVIDATNVRGLHIDGGFIQSTLTTNQPSCGLLLGPKLQLTCGNNSFRDLNIHGNFTIAAYINVGSETTYHYNCYFAQTNTDVSSYAFIADGAHSRSTVTSAYTTLRANNTTNSFTNNKFYGCHFRHYGNGSGMYLRYTSDWAFDAGCYHLAFDRSNIECYQIDTQRNINLSVEGLFETTLGASVDHAITFIIPDGGSSAIAGFRFITNTPHAMVSVFRVAADGSGTATTGTMRLTEADIRISGGLNSSKLFHQCENLTINGDIRYRDSARFNLYDIQRFHGVVYTTDGSLISGNYGTKTFNYTLYDEVTYGGQVLSIVKGPQTYLGVQNGVRPVIRAEGAATDIDIALQGKGTGNVRFGTHITTTDVAITGYITIKDASGSIRKLAVIT